MTEPEYADRVARGAALLDAKWPEWRDQVDLGQLDVGDPDHCMTAQYAQYVHGPGNDYEVGMNMLALNRGNYASHGFNGGDGSDGDDEGYDDQITKLNDLWRDLIVQHRYAPEPRSEGDAPA